MKRTVLTLLSVMMTAMSVAQGYVRIDTVIRPYYQFDWESWLDSGKRLCINHHQLSFDYYYSMGIEDVRRSQRYVFGDQVQYNYIKGGAEVYGLEAWIYIYYCNISGPNTADVPPSPAEFLYLYDARPDSFELKAQVQILANDSTPFIWESRWVRSDTSCFGPYDIIPLPFLKQYRYYFSEPINVNDSFYVGGSYMTWRQIEMALDSVQELPPRIEMMYGYMASGVLAGSPDDRSRLADCQIPITKTKVRWGDIDYIPGGTATQEGPPPGYQSGVWVPSWSNYFWMIFPLIKTYDTIWTVDTPACLPVRDFSIMSRYGDTVMLRWSPLEGRSEFQVSYGPEGMDPDSGTLVNVTTNRWRFIDSLHTGEVMTAYVRTVCRELDTLRFSEWSEGVEWQTRNAGIVQPDEDVRLSSRIHLQPNPAKERVEVVTPCGVKGIEVYGSYGIRWREFPAGTADFDVSDWAKGTYVVVIRTLAGSVTKKLVVE